MAADSEVTFGVNLEETGGDDAAAALEALREKLLSDTAALREMNSALKNLKGGTSVNIDAFKALKDQIDAQKVSIAQAQADYVNLGGAFSGTAAATRAEESAARAAAIALREQAAAAARAAAEARQLAAAEERASAAAAKNQAAAAAKAEAAALAAAKTQAKADADAHAALAKQEAAAAAAAQKMQGAAAKEAAALHNAAAQAAGGTGKLGEMAGALGALGGPAGAAGQRVAQLGEGIKKLMATAGKAGPIIALVVILAALTAGFLAAAVAVTVWGIKLADAQRDASDVLKLENQFKRFTKLVGETFGGLKTDALMKGLQRIINLFDSSTASGRALKFLFESLFQPLVDLATAAIPIIVSVFKTLLIWGLKAYVAIMQFSKTDTFAALVVVLKILGVAVGIVAAGFVVMAALFAAVIIVPIVATIAIFTALVAALGYVWDFFVAAWNGITGVVSGAVGAVLGFMGAMVDAGANLIAGLAQGIANGAGAVVDAVVGAASGAINAAKAFLGISSPSKVFAGLGNFTTEGFAGGIAANDNAATAAEEMASDATAAAAGVAAPAPSGGGRAASSGGGVTVNVTINVEGVSNAEQLQTPAFKAQMADAFEQACIELGLVA